MASDRPLHLADAIVNICDPAGGQLTAERRLPFPRKAQYRMRA